MIRRGSLTQVGAVLILLALVAAACSSDSGSELDAGGSTTVGPVSTTADASEDLDALCDAARRIRDLDDEMNGAINEIMNSTPIDDLEAVETATAEMVAELRAMLPETDEAYLDLEEAVPQELVADVQLLREFTLEFAEALTMVESVEDLETQLTSALDEEAAFEAVQATLRIDDLTREACDIVIAN